MAPYSFKPAGVELHESEIAKPQPLRIIKRSQTITGSSPRGKAFGGGRGWSGSSSEAQGSPPLGPDRPLTVHKLRRGRPTILCGGLDGPLEIQHASAASELIAKNAEQSVDQSDPETTPKARQPVPRTSSAGTFLKAELLQGNKNIASGRFSTRSSRSSDMSGPSFASTTDIADMKVEQSSTSPQRRFSRSKSFFLRAVGGRSIEEGKPNRRIDSGGSRTTLIRRASRNRSKSSASQSSSGYSSSTTSSYDSGRHDSADIGLASTIYYSSSSSAPAPLSHFSSSAQNSVVSNCSSSTHQFSPPAARDVYVLVPEITITPEVPSVDRGISYLWVAVEVTGVLRRADGEEEELTKGRRCPSQSQNTRLRDLQQYGSLHSMRIDLIPAPDCSVIEIIGNLHEPTIIRASETHLVIAKMLLKKLPDPLVIKEPSSDLLIADLEGRLCDVTMAYLTVRITYQHSAFLSRQTVSPASTDPNTSHSTLIQTKASASIMRVNQQSAWSPRASQTLSTPIAPNPIIALIERHLPSYAARDAIRQLANERVKIPLARRFANRSDPIRTSDETLTSASRRLGLEERSASASEPTESPLTPLKTISEQGQSFDSDGTPGSSDDPARKIWAEMRRTSRGGHMKPRRTSRNVSMNATSYFTVDEGINEYEGESDLTGDQHGDFGVPALEGECNSVQQERKQIMEVALRNQRSLGAETLRSIAPSITGTSSIRGGGTSRGRTGPGSAVGGVGLGRNWGWTAFWG